MTDQAAAGVRLVVTNADDVQRELAAMRSVVDVLRTLDGATRLRVLNWALAREGARDAAASAPARQELKLEKPAPDPDDLCVGDLADLFEPRPKVDVRGVNAA